MPATPRRVLLRHGTILSPARSDATALLTVDGVVRWLGDEREADRHAGDVDEVVELAGRLVTPGFVDAHVHLSKTGFALATVDLATAESMVQALDLLAAEARRSTGVVFAHGWDETRWPESRPFTSVELDRAVGERVAYVSRVDAHSAVVSTELLDQNPQIAAMAGWRGDGRVERDAHHAARDLVDASRTTHERKAALLRALRSAAAMGITSVHDANAPHIAPYDDIDLIADLRGQLALPDVVPYWGAWLGGDHADSAPSGGFAGDLCVDGAIGSRTAALDAPYADAPSEGHLYLDDLAIRDHVVWCTERGIQAGFHVIGDRGVRAVASGLRLAADKVGVPAMVAARHRLEHVEMPSPETLATLGALGVVASVQPAFDAAWGAPGELYEQRLGASRARPMNPFASMHRAGVLLAFGSDSPVTPMNPWAGVRAAMRHHNPHERLTAAVAFDAHTRGGHRARRDDAGGVLVPGAPASYAVWDTVVPARSSADADFPVADLDTDAALPTCVRTVVSGAVAYDEADAS